MLISFLSWLKQHPLINLALVLLYYVLVVLPHNAFGAWIAKTLDKPLGRDTYNLLILALGMAALTAYTVAFWKGIRTGNSHQQRKITSYFILTLLLMLLAINTILVINIEIIHFLQYAVIGVLLFPLLQNYMATLLAIILLGSIDEAYQYWILSPSYEYYDFNDVILDLLGGALGLILVAAYPLSIDIARGQKMKQWMVGGFSIIALVIVAGIWSEKITVYPQETVETSFQLIRKYRPGFWQKIHPNVTYHVVRPLEGLLLLGGLFVLYSRLGKAEA